MSRIQPFQAAHHAWDLHGCDFRFPGKIEERIDGLSFHGGRQWRSRDKRQKANSMADVFLRISVILYFFNLS